MAMTSAFTFKRTIYFRFSIKMFQKLSRFLFPFDVMSDVYLAKTNNKCNVNAYNATRSIIQTLKIIKAMKFRVSSKNFFTQNSLVLIKQECCYSVFSTHTLWISTLRFCFQTNRILKHFWPRCSE